MLQVAVRDPKQRALVVPMIVALALSACASPTPSRVEVFVTRDGRIVAEPVLIGSGEAIIVVENDDDRPHRMVLARTSSATLPVRAGVVPMGEGSDVTFDGRGYEVLVKLERMRAYFSGPERITATIHTYLDPGRYVLFSNLRGDYERGLHVQIEAR
jgi:hypothetical protein